MVGGLIFFRFNVKIKPIVIKVNIWYNGLGQYVIKGDINEIKL